MGHHEPVKAPENATEDNLLQSQRHERILELLRKHGQVHASALADTFAVSAYTIRRDLDDLADAGLLERVHGGAVPASTVPRTYSERQLQGRSEKAESALAALTLIEEDQLVLVDGGSTAALVVEALPARFPATFITHVPSVAAALAEKDPAEVILLGGRVDPRSRAAVGATTVQGYRSVTADLCLLGIGGIHILQGVTSPYHEEALVRAAMVAAADRVVGLAIGEKLGTAGAFRVAAATDLTHLSVERGVDDGLLTPFREAGVTIVQLPPPKDDRGASSTTRPSRPRRKT